jgi:hypothetical protein
MTSISNIFSNLDNSKNHKKPIKSTISNNSNNFSATPSLSQGNKFKNFQRRIQNNLEII